MLPVALSALLSLVTFVPFAQASPCIAFDINFNLFLFGVGGKDFTLGQQSTWSGSGTATDITASGRPPFDGTNTTCYLAQFFNAIYVLNGDQSNPNNVGIYDATAKSWTTQTISAGSGTPAFDMSNFVAILDHDTNFFYALSGGVMFDLNFGTLKAAQSSVIPWNNVGNPSFTTTGYNPVMALAQNHIHFLNVPGAQPGTADIFVIHFSFFQPTPQSYPINGSSNNFPETHGQTASFFQNTGVQQEFAFIPDDGSQTYVINVESNTTAALAGPSDKSPSSFYASITSLVQLTSEGKLFFLPYTQGDAATNQAAQWTPINLSGLPTPNSTSSSTASSAATGASSSGTGKSSPTSGGSSTGTGTGTAPGSSNTTSGALGLSTSAMTALMCGIVMALIGVTL